MRNKLLIFAIVALAFFLRAYRINENFNLTAEFGQNLLDIKNAIAGGYLPLVGPATSHPWLHFGPLYYWIGIFLMKIFTRNPLVFAWLGVIGGTLIVILNYLVIKKIFEQRVALISSFLIAVSPLFIQFSREARFFSFVPVLVYLLMWTLFKVWNLSAQAGKNLKYLFWAGLIFGLMFSFHYSPLIFIPVILLIFWLKRRVLKAANYLHFVAGFLIPNISNFQMLGQLAVWIPYRIAGFLGVYPKNNLSTGVVYANFNVINQFFGEMFTQKRLLWFPITIVILGSTFYMGSAFFKKKKINFGWTFILASTFFGLLAIFIHGDVPVHYFLPIFPIPIIVSAIIIARQKILILFVVAILVINFNFFLSSNKFYKNPPSLTLDPHFVPYQTQFNVARFIVDNSKGKPFSLFRKGPYDYFEGNFAQNYRYLMWLFGNEPKEGAPLRYTIFENADGVLVVKEVQ